MYQDVNKSAFPWFAVYVKHRHEKHVLLGLESKGYESFLPTYTKVHEARKQFEIPLFPGYVFSRLNTHQLVPILSTPGVFTVVSNGSQPAPVSDLEIERIRRILATGSTICPWPYLSAQREVCVTSGALRGIHGVIVDERNPTWLVMSIHLLQRSVALKIERSQITW